MKCSFLDPPRVFQVAEHVTLKDMGEIALDVDEQVTFRTKSGKPNDILQKDWGFYLSNSINRTLRRNGFRTALVESRYGGTRSLYLNLVEDAKVSAFMEYLQMTASRLICWLDER